MEITYENTLGYQEHKKFKFKTIGYIWAYIVRPDNCKIKEL